MMRTKHYWIIRVCFMTLFWICTNGTDSSRILPVYDIRTKEVLGFREDFLKIVLQQQNEIVENQFKLNLEEPLDSEGYIINQEGHLVPFKVYKKGYYAGNHLAPRNCRGGSRFHRRAQAEPSRNVYKRKVSQQNNPEMLRVYDVTGDDPFTKGPVHAEKAQSPKHANYRDVQIPESSVYHTTNDDSQLFTHRMATGKTNIIDNYRNQGIADPPPLDRKASAIVEEYPIYDTLQALLSSYYDQPDASKTFFDPREDLSLFAISKRR